MAIEGYACWTTPSCRGKSGLLNAAIAQTESEIVVLSDANTEYRPDAVLKLVRWFADPRVHTVCGRLVLRDPVHGRNVDGLYWRYETFIKKHEGRLGALLVANGAIYAIRRGAYVPIPGNTIVDDFVIPLASKLRHHGSIVYDPEAVASEETPAKIASEFHRRVRIGTGAYQSLAILWRLLNPRHGWTAFAFLSHKLLRWLVPFFLLGALVSNLLLLGYPLYRGMLAAQIVGYAGSAVGSFLPGRGLPSKLVRAHDHAGEHEPRPSGRLLALVDDAADRSMAENLAGRPNAAARAPGNRPTTAN